MEEFKKILNEAIEVLRIKEQSKDAVMNALNHVYNAALDDVKEQVIKRIPN